MVQDCCLLSLTEYGIGSGARLVVIPDMQSGHLSDTLIQLDPSQEAIRRYCFGLSRSVVVGFFNAEETLRVRIPLQQTFGILKFRLVAPMSEEGIPLPAMNSDMHVLHEVSRPNDTTYVGLFSGSVPAEHFNYRGVVSRTKDTIVFMLDNMLIASRGM